MGAGGGSERLLFVLGDLGVNRPSGHAAGGGFDDAGADASAVDALSQLTHIDFSDIVNSDHSEMHREAERLVVDTGGKMMRMPDLSAASAANSGLRPSSIGQGSTKLETPRFLI